MTANIHTAADLRALRCSHQRQAIDSAEAQRLTQLLDGWSMASGKLVNTFGFNNYYETMAFVNALAFISHREDHHPELVVGYQTCQVRYDTHSVNGLSINDFICAAKADALGQA